MLKEVHQIEENYTRWVICTTKKKKLKKIIKNAENENIWVNTIFSFSEDFFKRQMNKSKSIYHQVNKIHLSKIFESKKEGRRNKHILL